MLGIATKAMTAGEFTGLPLTTILQGEAADGGRDIRDYVSNADRFAACGRASRQGVDNVKLRMSLVVTGVSRICILLDTVPPAGRRKGDPMKTQVEAKSFAA